jgi:hypothetical protein
VAQAGRSLVTEQAFDGWATGVTSRPALLLGNWTALTIGLTVVEMNRWVDCRWWAGNAEAGRKGRRVVWLGL